MKLFSLILAISLFTSYTFSQNDLLKTLEQDSPDDVNYTLATFKSTRVMNGHSTERMPHGQLDFRVSHRFGTINSGGYEFFGLDQSTIRLGLEYGFLKWMMAGIGRSSNEKTYDAFIKFSLLRQSTGAKMMPVSVSVLTSAALKTIKFPGESDDNYFNSRMAYTGQIIVARKFSQLVSLQVAPTFIHRNLAGDDPDPSEIFAIGTGARIKLTNRISLNGEYYYLPDPGTFVGTEVFNPLSIGFDIQTGGHVFQLIFTNSLGMIEKSFIGETTGKWGNGDIHFGFNISRVFKLRGNDRK